MNADRKPKSFDDLVAACRSFAECYRAFLACDGETRADIEALLVHTHDSEMDEWEQESAFATIAQSLFPDFRSTADIDDEDWMPSTPDEIAISEALDREEATFADHLSTVMTARGITQTELATKIGVGQPAIAMMLQRACRPQRRTVENLAQVLGVNPCDLWPAFQTADPQRARGMSRATIRSSQYGE